MAGTLAHGVAMIFMFTDFGPGGPYTGQMQAVLYRVAPEVPHIDLISDAPAFDPRASGYLLAALAGQSQAGDVFLCVVDPGVGGPRRALILEADGRWYVGPDNGLLDPVARRAQAATWWEVTWRPPALSRSFHGRDLFAPVAARLANGDRPEDIGCQRLRRRGRGVPEDWPRIIYIDWFGNLVSGIRASSLSHDGQLGIGGYIIPRAGTFSEVPEGQAFWYENSMGLVEIAVNQGAADEELEIEIGERIEPMSVRHRRNSR